MGIKFHDVELFADTFRRVPPPPNAALLTLGVQDVYFSYPDLAAFLKEKAIPSRDLSPADILPTTGMAWAPQKDRDHLIHQKSLFAALGFAPDRVRSMDASNYESPDFVHDLNTPVPASLHDQFDVIFDGGTLEHVFSARDAFFNMAAMLKIGGLAIHHAPVDWPDHGFYNFNPTLFRDFYAANGFDEILLRFTATALDDPTGRDYHFHDAFPGYLRPRYGLLLWAAYRKRTPFTGHVPTQGRYRELWKRS